MEGEVQDILYGTRDGVYLKNLIALRTIILSVSSLSKCSDKQLIDDFSIIGSSVIGLHVVIVIALVDNTTPTTFRAVLIVATVALHNLMACKVYRLLKFDLIDIVSSSFIGSEEYDHNVMPDFAVREDSNDASVIYLHTVPRNGGSEDLHSPMEFYTDRHK